MRKVLAVDALLAPLVCSAEPLGQLCFRTVSTRVLLAFALVFSPALELALADSPSSEGVDEEVYALVQELRSQPRARELGCTPCALARADPSAPETPEDARRWEIYDQLHALGSAAVPALARMLQSSLQGSDADLKSTVVWTLSDLSGERVFHDHTQHGKNDIGAALPALLLALDDPTVRAWAAGTIGAIGPKEADAVPKLVALLDNENQGVVGGACNGLRGIEPLPALRQARSDPNPDKRRFAQNAVASIEEKCFDAAALAPAAMAQIHEGSRCDAPPYGDTPAAYEEFAKPFVSISLGPPKRLLRTMCILKFQTKLAGPLRSDFGVSEQDVIAHGTVALVEKQLVALVKESAQQWQQFQKGGDSPAELFLCFEPDGSCQLIPATPSTPIHSLLECQGLAGFLSQNGPSRIYRVINGVKYGDTDGRFVVEGAGAWYECRSKYVGEWELQGLAYRLDQASAVWVLIASGSGLSYYVDTSSITFHGDGRRAWFRLTFPHHSQRWDDGIKYVAEQSIVVAASPSPPAGTVTYPYSGGFTASGGSPPYTWRASGALPPGLMLGSDGTVSGTPTQIGSFPFSVTATDSAQMPASGPPLATQIVINNPPALALNATPAPPTGVDGVPYGPFSFSVTGGFLPLTWSTTPSSLPPGLSLGTDGSFAGGTERSVIPQGRGGCYVSTLVLSSAELFK